MTPQPVTWRCTACGRVLALYVPPVGLIRLRCKRCGTLNELSDTDQAA